MAVVDETNAIGTTYLRAQTLAEPMRTESIDLIRRYTDTSIRLSNSVAGSGDAVGHSRRQRHPARALEPRRRRARRPALDSAPRLYVETLNEMIDMQTVRVSTLNNRVPGAVLVVEVLGAAFALGLLAFYLAIWGEASCPCCSRQASSRCCSSSPSTSTARPGG